MGLWVDYFYSLYSTGAQNIKAITSFVNSWALAVIALSLRKLPLTNPTKLINNRATQASLPYFKHQTVNKDFYVVMRNSFSLETSEEKASASDSVKTDIRLYALIACIDFNIK